MGTVIREAREKRAMTQTALAKAAGITRIYVAKIEAGEKVPSIPILLKLAKALKVKPGKLLE
jgi:XRE family transcriptional regulator, regulator of sulfur utilization